MLNAKKIRFSCFLVGRDGVFLIANCKIGDCKIGGIKG